MLFVSCQLIYFHIGDVLLKEIASWTKKNSLLDVNVVEWINCLSYS